MSSSALAECLVRLGQRTCQAILTSYMCKVMHLSAVAFFSQHLDQMHCFFLFRLMCCGCCGDKTIRISADVCICDFACYV